MNTKIITYLYSLLIVLYVISLFFISLILDYILLILLLSLLIILIFQFKSALKYLIILIISFSIYIILTSTMDIMLLSDLKSIINILCLLAVIQLIGIPILMMDLKPLLHAVLSKVKNPLIFSLILALTTMFLGVFIHVTVVSIIYNVVQVALCNIDFNYRRYLGNTLKQGFAMSLLWSPFSINMGIILNHVPVRWVDIGLPMFIIALLGIGLSSICEYFCFLRKEKCTLDIKENIDGNKVHKIGVKLLKYIFCVLIFVVSLGRYTDLSMIDVLILCALVIPLLWTRLNKEYGVFIKTAKEHFLIKVPQLKNLFIIITTAGFLVLALRSIGFDDLLNNILHMTIDYFGPFGTMLIIIIIMLLSAWIGLHPFITIAIICQTINFESQIINPEVYAYILLVAAALSNLISPTTVSTAVISSLVNKSIFEVAVKWNVVFVISFIVVFACFFLIAV